jgi:hypothetical protein
MRLCPGTNEVVPCSVADDPSPTHLKSKLPPKSPAWKHEPPVSLQDQKGTICLRRSGNWKRHRICTSGLVRRACSRIPELEIISAER